MKKGLITIVGVTLLAVSCSNKASQGKSFAFNEGIEYYDSFGIEGVTLPKYKVKDKNAEFEVIDDYMEDYEILEVRVYDSPRKEMLDWVSDLKKGGWKLSKDDNGDYEGYFKANNYAEIQVQDWTLATYDEDDNIYDCIRIFFQHAPIPGPEWPTSDLQAIFEEYDADYYEVPALVGENALFYAEEYWFWGIYVTGAMVVVSGATDAEIETYISTTLPGAGWTVDGDADYGEATKAFEDIGGVATIEFGMDEDEFLIILDFELGQLPLEEFPAEQIAAAFNTLELPAFTLVVPDGEGITYNYLFDDENLDYLDKPNLCYDFLKINNMTSTLFVDYLAKMQANGWSTTDEELPYNYYKHFEDLKLTAHIKVNHNIGEEEGATGVVTITIYYIGEPDPSEVWPAEDVAALLSTLGTGITDVLPAVDFEGATFKMNKQGVKVFVEAESQDLLLASYKSTLSNNGFIYDEEKDRYASPNEQYAVKLSKDTDGNMLIALSVPGFISKNAQAWLDSRGLTGETVPDFSSLEEFYKDGGNTSSCYKVFLIGDHTEAIKALLVGYTIPETPHEKWGYECMSASGLVEIDFVYHSDDDETVVWFYYYPDIANSY